MQLWAKVQKECPDIKLQMIPYMNSPESAREILKNLGENIDIVGGIFDETMLKLRQCAGMELSRQRICDWQIRTCLPSRICMEKIFF